MKSLQSILLVGACTLYAFYASATIAISTTNHFDENEECRGSFELLAIGDDGPFQITIEGIGQVYEETLTMEVGDIQFFHDLLADDYLFTIVNGDGCVKEQLMTIACGCNIVIDESSISVSHPESCNTNDGEISAGNQFTISGAVPPIEYLWSTGASTSSFILENLSIGIYGVTVVDDNGCEAETTITLNPQNLSPQTDEEEINMSCEGVANGSFLLGFDGNINDWTVDVPGVNFQLHDNGGLEFFISAESLFSGEYCVSVINKDVPTCQFQSCYHIEDLISQGPLSINGTIKDVCYGSMDGGIDIAVSGGNPFDNGNYNYIWSNGAQTQDISGIAEGTYSVTVTDKCGRTETATFVVEQLEDLVIGFEPSPTCSFDNTNQGISVDISTGDFTFEWSNGQTSQNLMNVAANQEFSLTVTDEVGCQFSYYNLPVWGTEISFEETIHPSSYSECNGRIVVSATGIGAPFELLLQDENGNELFVTSPDIYEEGLFEFPLDLCEGDYKVYIKSGFDCIELFEVSLVPADCDVKFEIERIDYESVHSNGCSQHASTEDGLIQFSLSGEITDPDLFNFTLIGYEYDYINPYIVAEGIGATEFDGLTLGNYTLEVENLDNPNCSYSKSFELPACNYYNVNCNPDRGGVEDVTLHSYEELSDHKPGFIWLEIHRDEDWDGFIVINWTDPSGASHVNGYTSMYSELADFCKFENLQIPGEYCFTISDGCENEFQLCHTLVSCPESLTFGRNFPWTYGFEPSNRNDIDASITGECYRLNGPHSDLELCEEVPYYELAGDGVTHEYFYYTPFDDADPCGGGTIEMYQYVYDANGTRSVERTNNYEFTADAIHEFSWSNTNIDLGQYSAPITEWLYGVPNHLGDPNSAVCANGTYCIFDSQDIFDGLVLNRDILLAACGEWKHLCDIWPDSWHCENSTIQCDQLPCPSEICPGPCPTCDDGIQNGSEWGVDCGGPLCEPCSCNNGIQDGDETGVDCGGTICPPCPSCHDGILNGNEEDVDCGGDCPIQCPDCTNGVQDYGEAGIDCGGWWCPPCEGSGSGGSQSGCQYNIDCPPGYECNPITGECVLAPCVFDSDCPDGYECDSSSGECVPIECFGDGDNCPDGFICGQNGVCVEENDILSCNYVYESSQNNSPDLIDNIYVYLFDDILIGDELLLNFGNNHAGIRVRITQDGPSNVLYDACGYADNVSVFSQFDQIPIYLEIIADEAYCQDSHAGRYDLTLSCIPTLTQEIESENRKESDSWNIRLSPNPFTSEFLIEWEELYVGNFHYQIYSLMGEKIVDRSVVNTEGQKSFVITDLENKPDGVYFLKVVDENENVFENRMIKLAE